MRTTRLDTARIHEARGLIDPLFLDTPLYPCEAMDLGCSVSIKLETANPVRSFKGRGTEVVVSRLDGGAAVCASAGNLGQALAWSGTAMLFSHHLAARRPSESQGDLEFWWSMQRGQLLVQEIRARSDHRVAASSLMRIAAFRIATKS
ncbi:pyridoxal-phosphate dependent enzyme [Mycolicibacterium arenosum]|uniref:PLP-dependent lyase/thiolase n=1 Tax=Mycolicibacterium arenosum TaxID=2952157 RepID=A0ABT1M8F1_9MYCO|nr:pyridoxal-phosphate dependent enzyme [Mycolicibacterium sp. CAU 1645]MCP9274077.1 PLP-dependent lyase/thiolase [Mycolicibacterium sp. CAU 1645]